MKFLRRGFGVGIMFMVTLFFSPILYPIFFGEAGVVALALLAPRQMLTSAPDEELESGLLPYTFYRIDDMNESRMDRLTSPTILAPTSPSDYRLNLDAAKIATSGLAPAEYIELIYQAIDETGSTVDPTLVMGMIQQESGWDPNATSGSGAMGLMQLMPGTASDMGVSNPYDPAQNIRGGVKYITWLVDRYNGDTRRAVMAYHAGPGNIENRGPTSLDIYYADQVFGYQSDFQDQAFASTPAAQATTNPFWPYRTVSPPAPNDMHGDGNWPGRDYVTPAGTPLYAPEVCPCRVVRTGFDTYVGPHGANNSYILLESLDGVWQVMYMHGDYATAGNELQPGEFMGIEASIGNSLTAHTHVSVRRNGVIVDPEDY